MSGREGAGVDVEPKQAQTIAAVLFEDTAAVGPMKKVHGEWLVREAARLWPMWAGIRFFGPTSQRAQYLLASYHHPARLCWSWSLSLTFTLFRRSPYLWPYKFGYWRDGNWAIRIPYLAELRWSRQTYDWMLSNAGKQRLMHIVDMVLASRESA